LACHHFSEGAAYAVLFKGIVSMHRQKLIKFTEAVFEKNAFL
jgi:hypothetical protein